MLNSLDLEKKSLINYLIGAAITYIICFCFYSRFDMAVFMAAFGAGLIVSSVLDVIDIKRRSGMKLSFIRPLLISIAATYPAWLFTEYVNSIIHIKLLSMFVAAAGGACFMALLLVIFGAVDFEINLKLRRDKKPKAEKPIKTRRAKKRKNAIA